MENSHVRLANLYITINKALNLHAQLLQIDGLDALGAAAEPERMTVMSHREADTNLGPMS